MTKMDGISQINVLLHVIIVAALIITYTNFSVTLVWYIYFEITGRYFISDDPEIYKLSY